MSGNIKLFEYCLKYDSGETSETFEWDEELDGDELEAYDEFVADSRSIDESPLLGKVIERVAREILSGNLDDFILCDCGYELCVTIPGEAQN